MGVAVAYINRRWKLLPRVLSREPSIEPDAAPAKRASAGSGHSLAGELDELAKANPGTSTKLTRAVGIALLLAFLGQGAMFIRANSQTFDEAIHLVSGYALLATGKLRLYPQHAPLAKELSALPIYLWYRLPFKLDPAVANQSDPYFYGETFFGANIPRDFLYGSSVPADRLLTLGRIPILLLGAILVALVGWWSYRLWGPAAGIVGMWLAAFEPNLVAHSSLITSDLAPTLFSFLTLYLLWEYKRRLSGWLLAATGISFGLALVSKFSTLLILGILAVAIVVDGLPLPRSKLSGWVSDRAGPLLEGMASGAVILFFAAMVIPVAYFGFHEGFTTWIAGLEEVRKLDLMPRPGFFMGEYSDHGWWSYFLVALLIKVPAGSLFLIFAALIFYRAGIPLGRKEVIFLLFPAFVFIAGPTYGRVNLGIRYILPAFPFLFVIASRVATFRFRRAWVAPVLCGLPLLMTTVSSLRVAPHDLAYFNEFAGGPGNGYRYLSDSNIDWGQDLKGLKAYMDSHGLARIYLSYFGSAPPSAYGIAYQYVPSSWTIECCTENGPPPGSREILAVSVTNLQETLWLRHSNLFRWLYDRKPIAKIGYSIYLYDITGDIQAHLHLADDYMNSGGPLPLAKSEVTKALLLNPSNPQARLYASLLHIPAATGPPSGTGNIPPRITPAEFTFDPQRGGITGPDLAIPLLKFTMLLLAVGITAAYGYGHRIAPVESIESVESIEPVESNGPVEPVESVESNGPVEPVAPVAPNEPNEPIEPVEPIEPILPAAPAGSAGAKIDYAWQRAMAAFEKLTAATRAKLTIAAGLFLLLVFFGEGLTFIGANSQTFDEAMHLTSGYSYLATHGFRMWPQDPPLIRELSALPAYLLYRLPFQPDPQVWNRPDPYFYGDSSMEWILPTGFLYHSAVPADRLLDLSRVPNLLLGVVLVGLIGWWSYRLWGLAAAIVGMWLAALDPNLVAHSSLITTDLGAMLFSFLTLYLLWEYTARASPWILVAIGLSLGLALVSKYSTVLLFGSIAVAVVADRVPLPGIGRSEEEETIVARLLKGSAVAVAIVAIAALVFPIVYFGFHQGFATWIAGLQKVRALEKLGNPAFFMGQLSIHGWWSYFVVAFLIKTPVATLFLIFAALALYRAGIPLRRKELVFLLVPALVFIAAPSCGRIDIGLRHILPAFPFLFVLASRIATVRFPPRLDRADTMRRAAASDHRLVAQDCPPSARLFNEIAGGPGNGPHYLSDSNIDSGSGLKEP